MDWKENIHLLDTDDESRLSWIEQFDRFHKELSIYRTILITNNEMIRSYLASLLEKKDYSVQKGIGHTGIEGFLQRKKRILVLTIEEFFQHEEETPLLVGEHNMIIMENLRKEEETRMLQWIRSSFSSTNITTPYYLWMN